MHFKDIALKVPTILVPGTGIDLEKWAVVACDQFTSQPEYWHHVEERVGTAPSTLHLIFPEVYLEETGQEQRIHRINQTMRRYLDEGLLRELRPGFMRVERRTAHAPSRRGLVVALDLEHYDYHAGATTLIRATEGTVIERLPPRVRIREQALLESPHIMVLIDDPARSVIEPLFEHELEEVYATPLMLDGGFVRGCLVDEPALIAQVARSLSALAAPERARERYRCSGGGVLLYAMGDGNHSLATAKAIWEQLKRKAPEGADLAHHPARYALVELVNLHDQGLEFEPIHRVVFGVNGQGLLECMGTYFRQQGAGFRLGGAPGAAEGSHTFGYLAAGQAGTIHIDNPPLTLEVGCLQAFLDHYILEHPQARIDYIHGDEVVRSLSQTSGTVGFLLPAIPKHDLFRTIVCDGALPRKTFSMGHASEKRYYLECRRVGR